MSSKVSFGILATAAILCITSTALADKLCLQTTVNKKTFKVTNKSVVAAKCPRGYTQLADTSSFRGATGSQGPAGIVNLAACRTVSQTCSHGNGNNFCSANCNTGEFAFISGDTYILNGSCSSVGTIGASTAPSGTYSNGISAGRTFFTYTNEACSYTASITVICCPVS